jgi:nucleoside-diphosphate-sugar epimerase
MMGNPALSPGRLLITGVPGWLATALLNDLHHTALAGLQSVRALLHPASAPLAEELRRDFDVLSEIAYCDLGQPVDVDDALAGVDTVLHSAAIIHVQQTQDWYRINTDGTIALAKAARRAGVRRFVFISSNAAGGRARSFEDRLTEEIPAEPLSHYGKSKQLAEDALLAMHEPDRFEVVILRPSMFYGPPVPARHVDIYKRILHGKMPMVGNGLYSRSITYIDHLVQACRLALTHPGAGGEIFYIVDEQPYTTKAITDAMATALGCKVSYIRLPSAIGPVCYLADRVLAAAGIYVQPLHLVGESTWHVGISPAKAIRRLGYKPSVSLEEGMRRSIEWCRNKKLI